MNGANCDGCGKFMVATTRTLLWRDYRCPHCGRAVRIEIGAKADLANLFWRKVRAVGADDCWEWLASRNKRGYGYYGYAGRTQKAHRVAFELSVSKIPVGLCVCHRCDNPPCVNPAHLFLGTKAGHPHQVGWEVDPFVATRDGQ